MQKMNSEDIELFMSQVSSLKSHAVSYQLYDIAFKLREAEKMLRVQLNKQLSYVIEKNHLNPSQPDQQ